MNGRRYLIDTHILIWALNQSETLPPRYSDLLAREDECVVSIISIWEIAIKKGLGKLHIGDNFADVIVRTGVAVLPITLKHIAEYETLPYHHRDPFDRMLIAQARAEKLSVLTVDRNFALYDVTVA